MATRDLNDLDVSTPPTTEEDLAQKIKSFVMRHVLEWESYRESNYDEDFKRYWNIYRGKFDQSLQLRRSERSKIVHPATQQAVDNNVAGIEDAVFGDSKWVELAEDARDQGRDQTGWTANLLRVDMEENDFIEGASDVLQTGAIYGTGIMKVNLEELGSPARISYKSVDPTNLCIDPAATTTTNGMGVATRENVPAHQVYAKMNTGQFRKVDLHRQTEQDDEHKPLSIRDLALNQAQPGYVLVTEYHGLIPSVWLSAWEALKEDPEVEFDDFELEWEDGDEMAEAIVVVGADNEVLLCFRNPLARPDRPLKRMILAYQHFRVPNRFWGMGLVEKALNSQSSLDAELRARIDNMALQVAPQLGINAQNLAQRGGSLAIKPGKVWLINGPPGESLFPFRLGAVDQTTFPQAGDLERMVQMSTGAVDTAMPIGQNPRNATATGMSMMESTVMKRSKRTIRSYVKSIVLPAVEITFDISFNNDKFYQTISEGDDRFVTVGTLGIMARELEQQQLVAVIQSIDDPSVRRELVKGYITLTTLPNRNSIVDMMEKAAQPDPEKQARDDRLEEIQFQLAELSLQNAQVEIAKTQSESIENLANAASKEEQTDINKMQTAVNALTADIRAQEVANKAGR